VLKEEEVIDTLLLKRAVVDTEEDDEEDNKSDVHVEHELVLLLDLLPPLSPLKSLPVTLDAKLKV
jgi:hypothetical protein